jgi:hypothetical protein
MNTSKAPHIPLRVTPAALERVRRDWNEIAGEPVTVEHIGGCLYATCSELAAYRLERKYNARPKCEAFFSKPCASWMFRLELRLLDHPPTVAELNEEFQAWMKRVGIPPESGDAGEVLAIMGHRLSPENRAYLVDFCQRFEAAGGGASI